MAKGNAVIRFKEVSFDFGQKKPILHEADFSVREGSKITLMGQNGAGKSTIFQLITGELAPNSGAIHKDPHLTIATARQVMPRNQLDLTVLAFFEKCFSETVYNIDVKIDQILEVVNLSCSHDRIIKSFSGGQQARLLLASALIQDPDLLLLDEPTNNLDKEGIDHLTKFLIAYPKTCIVISHDANFLNAFTEGVLYLDVFTHIVEQHTGNYFDLLEVISARIEQENRKNAQLAKKIIENKEKANYFANKGGKMRLVAKRMRQAAEEAESSKVEVRREDKTIRPFRIPCQEGLSGEIALITSLTVMKGRKPAEKKVSLSLRKNTHLLLQGPNGIGKSTLLESLARGTAKGAQISPGVNVGYYTQDFSTLNIQEKVFDFLAKVAQGKSEEDVRSLAAGFFITNELLYSEIGNLSEGQKGLVSFARLVLQKPGLLILDEPTNHMNFRHVPVIAKALNAYEGAMILVSHVPEFVDQIRIDEVLDLER
ncbi:MAG: ABC-F family ATP-binding cassette domain-containing protein [bacterium]|nr:ABC-F family ATP-binding cassette domain-containing protein [bacterium]